MSRSSARAFVLIIMLIAAACGDNPFDIPTQPTPTNVTETFAGTLNPNGAATHSFTVQTAGTLTATLMTVSPDSTIAIGLSLGTWNGAVCQIVLANDRALQGTVITGTASSFGNLCVRVYDVGNITEPTSYEVQVVHP